MAADGKVYRIWIAYLAGSSLAFARGSVRIYQTLASRAERGPPPVPATRADLYPPTEPSLWALISAPWYYKRIISFPRFAPA